LQLELTAFTRHTVCSVTPPPPELHAEGMGKVKIGRTIGVGTSVVQRVLGSIAMIAVFVWALDEAGPRLPNTD